MIIRDKNNIFKILFAWKGTVLPQVVPQMMMLFIISLVVEVLSFLQIIHVPQIPTSGGFTIFGVIISIFLVFRNNASYDRWWEGRKLWGSLIASSRHLDRNSKVLPAARRECLIHHTIAFANVLRDRLRQQTADLEQFIETLQLDQETLLYLDQHVNAPQYILGLMQEELLASYRAGEISDIFYTQVNTHIIELGAVQSGCDRIASTPLPYAYLVLLNRAVYCFCFLLPFCLGSVLGLFTPLLVCLLAYLFLGLGKLGAELEEPFGVQNNDLPLDSIVRLIERELLTSLGQPLPPPIEVKNHNLL